MLPFVQPTDRTITDTALSDGAFRVLVALALFKGKDNWCNPSQTTLGNLLGRTRQAIQRHLKELVRLGYIQHRTVKLPDATSKSDYLILRGVQLPVAGGSNRKLRGGQRKAPKGSNHRLQEAYTAKADVPNDTPPLRLVGGGEVSGDVDHDKLMADLDARAERARMNNAGRKGNVG